MLLITMLGEKLLQCYHKNNHIYTLSGHIMYREILFAIYLYFILYRYALWWQFYAITLYTYDLLSLQPFSPFLDIK